MYSIHPPMDSAAALPRRKRRRVADADRKRASRACDRCKARKNKCVPTASGSCLRCLQGSHPCRFDREGSPEEATVVRNSTAERRTTTTADEDDAPRASVGASSATHSTLGQSIKDDFSPGGGGPSEAFMWPRFLSRLREAFCLDSQPAPEEGDMAKLQARLSRTPPAEHAELRRVKKAVRRFPPRPVADFLVSVCIKYGTDLFFYFDQAQFISELESFYASESSRLRTDAGFVCLALAVFALGSHWTSLAKPDDMSDSSLPEDVDPSRIFYNQARILMADLTDRPSLRSVQAAYVLGVYLMPASAISASYVYMGLALRKALAIGLHLEPDDPTLSEDEKETRRRLWWSIYSLERTVTIKLNRPRSIAQDIITARLPRPTPRDSLQKFDNVQHQIANAKLVRILDILSEPGVALEREEALKNWKRTLPASLKLQNIRPRSPSYRAVFHLHLNYYFSWIDMGKVSVVTVVRARLRAVFAPDDEPPRVGADVQRSSDACIGAARKMLELFEGLSRSGNMARFSFTDLQGCSVATIIALLAGVLDRDSGYDGRVAFGLECLRKMAGGGNATARIGVRFVEALQSITNEARTKLLSVQSGRHANRPSSSSDRPTGYSHWAEWLLNNENADSSSDDDSSSVQSDEQTQGHSSGAAAVPDIMLSSAWDEAAALQLQEMSAAGFQLPLEGSGAPDPVHEMMPLQPDSGEWLPSFAWNDDQMYMMGLTGMDVLNFTGGLE
ncbi:C6 zinc finger domain protein [Colletotrichum sojae]|uniref:C6 zinc finger domain protein n=1 Tax=Colletotrichum sojae TaxID=2175907 RepID=A0A8H6IYP7_9PEZI|nr:C6 zinc finger domain protein [Colletotrichum sojae]